MGIIKYTWREMVQFYKGYRMELKGMSPQVHWIKMWEKGAEYVFGERAGE